MIALELALLLVLLAGNGVFALAEVAVLSSRKARLRSLALSGDAGAAAALRLSEAPARFLPTVQIGITLVGMLAGAVSGSTLAGKLAAMFREVPSLAPYADALGMALVVAPLSVVSLVIGELVPKRIGLSNPERFASLLARPLEWLSAATKPVVRALAAVTDRILGWLRVSPQESAPVSDDEVRCLLEEGARAGVFHGAEPAMVGSVLAFDQRPISDIMTPRGRVIFLREDEAPEVLWHKIVVSGHSCFPVYAGERGRVLGVVSVKSIYANLGAGIPPRPRDLMTPPLTVSENATVMSVLEEFKRTGNHFGVVVDAHGEFLGVVTLVDVLEAIVGDMPSFEERLKPAAVPRPDGSWLVDGAYPLNRLRRCLNNSADTAAVDERRTTVAAHALECVAAPAKEGATWIEGGWCFEVLDMDGTRVDKVLVTPVSKAADHNARNEVGS